MILFYTVSKQDVSQEFSMEKGLLIKAEHLHCKRENDNIPFLKKTYILKIHL